MWPRLLNMTRDDCRRTLRSLELEAYANMISVLRAQGPLEDTRKKLLEDLRGVLHISGDRHNAEARRVANDELLATIADQLVGPNTDYGWVNEARRKIPLMPRGIPQTAYTDIADKAAQAAAAENKEILKRLEAEKLATPKTSEEEVPEAEGETTEITLDTNESMDEILYAPIVMEDQTTKLWETELISRKRKVPEGVAVTEDAAVTPAKNVRNITVNTNQKHLNLSQLYSKFSQPAASKSSGQSKHSYNQVSKVSTSKSNQVQHAKERRSGTKHRAHKPKKTMHVISKAQAKKSQQVPVSPSKQFTPTSIQLEYVGPPGSFQASYAQSILGKNTPGYLEDIKPKGLSSPISDSPTMQLLTQPATVPHELGVSDTAHPEDPSSLQAKVSSTPKLPSKPCHLIIKKKQEVTSDKKVHVSDVKILQKPKEGIKVMSNRQVVVAPSTTQKVLNTTGKLVSTKLLGSTPRAQSAHTTIGEKMIVVSKSAEHKSLTNSKIIMTSTTVTASSGKEGVMVSQSNMSPKPSESIVAKGIPATDLKVSAKTFLLNPKSGQKMVVLPGKPKTKTTADGQTVPLLHLKGTPLKLVPVSSQPIAHVTKPSPTLISTKPHVVNTVIPSTPKVVAIEPIKTANMADIIPVRGLTPVTATPKSANTIVRPTTGKGSLIVVQKGATIGKALSFTKNSNDVSKIIMGKNVNQLLQASNIQKPDPTEGKGNVIVLELNNDQTGHTTTMSEILEGRVSSASHVSDDDFKTSHEEINEDTPVLFESQIPDEQTCNTSSLDSTTGSMEIIPMEETEMVCTEKDDESKSKSTKDTSSVTDWEMELDTVSRKEKDDDDKMTSLHLDLGMSSDSEADYMVDTHKSESKLSSQESLQRSTPTGDNSELYVSSGGLTHAGRTLLSQLQDDGSSSNDSSFALNKSKSIGDKLKGVNNKDSTDKTESEALTKAKEKLSEKVAKSQLKRIDIYSTAITSSDINLDSFSYLEEGMMAGDEMFSQDDKPGRDIHLSQLLSESASAAESRTVSDSSPLNKQ